MSWAFLILSILAPVLVAAPGPGPRAGDRGSIFVYLQPIEDGGSRLRFDVASLAALSEDGTTVPVPVSLDRVVAGQIDRQRRFAAGPVPAGRYSGLALRIEHPALEGREGPSDLVGPAGPVEAPLSFSVERNEAVVLLLRLDARRSVDEGYRFTPSFAVGPAVQPPVARLGLASSPEENLISLFDRLSREVVGVVPTGRQPMGMAIDSRRNRAYVALTGEDQVVAVDLLERGVVERLVLQGGDEPTELALTPEGGTILSVNAGSRTLSFIDSRSFVEVDRITVGDRPRSVLVEPLGRRAWVFNTAASSLSIVDLALRAVVGVVATESEPFRGQFNRRGDLLYVIHGRSPYLTVIETGPLAVQRRILIGTPATALKVDPRTDLIYLTPRGGGVIEVYDPISFLPVDSLRSGGEVAFLAVDGDENRLHASLGDAPELGSYSLAGKKIASRMDVGVVSYWISLVGER